MNALVLCHNLQPQQKECASGEYLYAANNNTNDVYQGIDLAVTATPPILSNLSADVSVDASVTVNVLNGVTGADSSTLTIITPPAHGSAYDPPGTITYTPDPGYVGSDSLVYRVCSALDNTVCSQATLSFDVLRDASLLAPNTGFGRPSTNKTFLINLGIASSLLGIGLVLRKRAGLNK